MTCRLKKVINNIKNELCISCKTAYLNYNAYSYPIKKANNKQLCKYVFVFIRDLDGNFDSVVIIDSKLGYPDDKKNFYWSKHKYPEIIEKQTFKLNNQKILVDYIYTLF